MANVELSPLKCPKGDEPQSQAGCRGRVIVHLLASPFYGGPERQVLGLATAMAKSRSVFLSFFEKGKAAPFLEQARQRGFEAIGLETNTPNLLGSVREVAGQLRRLQADLLFCHGYKPNIVGLWAARRAKIPVIAVARGWTQATWKVRINETLDRWSLRWMDRVVCVSEGQAVKVRRAGVRTERIVVIHNAIDAARFDQPAADRVEVLRGCFSDPPRVIVAAAGRLSPEKGFTVLVEAAARVVKEDPSVAFILFGDGPLRETLTQRITALGLSRRFVLAGFRDDLDQLLPGCDLVVLPSFTEGLPNVALEASAAGVAVVATAVGGTPEVVRDGINGVLVPSGVPGVLAQRILELTKDAHQRRELGLRGKELIRTEFTFAAQAVQYDHLMEGVRKEWSTKQS